MNNDVNTKKVSTPTVTTKQTVLKDVFKPVTTATDIEQQPLDEDNIKKPHAMSMDNESDKLRAKLDQIHDLPTVNSNEVMKDPSTGSDSIHNEDGFVEPKKTFKQVQLDSTTVEATASNRSISSFQVLGEHNDQTDQNADNDDNHNKIGKSDDNPDEDTNHPATLMILSNVMKMAKMSEDEEEVEIFAKWIENDVAPMMNDSARSIYNQAANQAQDLMRANTDKYLRKRINELTEKVKSTTEQSQINVMSHINGQ